MMKRSDITVAQKYAQVIEAYKIEYDYARNMESYQESITIDGQDRNVILLRLGRLALFYQTLDGKQSGFYNVRTKAFQDMDSSYNSMIKQAIKMSKKEALPHILLLPFSNFYFNNHKGGSQK